MRKKIWLMIGASLLSLVVLVGAVVGVLMIHSAGFQVEPPKESVINQTGLV